MRFRLVLAVLLLPTLAGAAPGWVLIGWNDLGMHCMDGDYSVFSILPPYNTVHAQLLDSSGRLVRNPAGITVTYEAVRDQSGSINTTSSWKTRFWQYAKALFGADVPPDAGLAGNNMPGSANTPQPMKFESGHYWFSAEGIPITTWDDNGNRNSYPMMRLTARDASGAVLATTDIVLPVSDEMDCRACHASGSRADTRPGRGWANAGQIERDYKLNILALHDQRSGTRLFDSATGGRPVLCASCHSSNALNAPGMVNLPSLTAAMHSAHANVDDGGLTLDSSQNRTACYRCHPGSETRCLRGAMGGAVASDGHMAMQCQSCHGTMSQVGGARTGWLDQPACQQCHTGTASRNAGQIRYTSTFDASGNRRAAVDNRFATNANVPAAGFSLYRFSFGHGGLACEACHGSTHAEYPSLDENDNAQSLKIQGHAGTISECTSCHLSVPANQMLSGPHNMHPTDQSWATQRHGDYAEHGSAQCQDCHGLDYRGTVLSRAFADRTYSAFGQTKRFARGTVVGCYACHKGPRDEDRNSNGAPSGDAVAAETSVGTEARLTLVARDPEGQPLTVRIHSQPKNGTVALGGSPNAGGLTVSANGTSVVYTPLPGWEGQDTFTWVASDGSLESAPVTATVNVRATARPQVTAEGVVNAASYKGNGWVAPGEMVTIFGTGLGPPDMSFLFVNSAGLLSRAVGATRVLFDGAPAPLIHAGATQVTAMVPYAVGQMRSTNMQVEYGGIRSEPVHLQVRHSLPGVFAVNRQGSGQGAILNQDGVTVNSPEKPAPRGSVVSIYITGEGMTDREWVDGQLASGDLAKPVLPARVLIGGVEAAVEYAGSAPGNVTGFAQVNARVPQSVQPGSAVPVVVRIGDEESQAGITMAVQ